MVKAPTSVLPVKEARKGRLCPDTRKADALTSCASLAACAPPIPFPTALPFSRRLLCVPRQTIEYHYGKHHAACESFSCVFLPSCGLFASPMLVEG